MVSLKDISQKCGVSIATVSKALNDHKDISVKTKEKIKSVAKKMGYFPNSQARALKTNRTYNIGVMFFDQAGMGLTHEFFSAILNSFKREAEVNGYDITFINKNIGSRKMSSYEHCKYRNVDGVLIACVDFKDPDVYEVINGDIPVVTIDYVFDSRTAIMSNNRQGIRELFDYVYCKGHRKIALIQGNKSSVSDNRLIGFLKAMSDYGLKVNDEYVLSGDYHNAELTYKLTKKLLELPNPPTCIFMPDDFSAIGGINAIEDLGLHIPDDVSIVGYDGLSWWKLLKPKLTTYRQDAKSMGEQAAKRLVSLLENPQTTFTDVIKVDGELLIGDSVGAILG